MNSLSEAILIVLLIASILGVISLVYLISSFRRISITAKKIDYLVEDITYKSEMLNSTVETISKVSNYIDVFEAVTKQNVKSATKLIVRNREQIYKVAERLKDLVISLTENDNKSKKKGKK
jgi:uncharacterized protein YoxC